MICAYSAWLHDFFQKRDIHGPDGRSLYEYRPTEDEFAELGRLLRRHGPTQSLMNPNGVSNREFWAAYLLYCSIESAFEYTEGLWNWERPEAILGRREAIAPLLRREGIRTGAAYWKLSGQIAESGHKFLGFVMGQGGIPLKALTQRKGWVGNLVHYLAWFRRYGTSEEVLQAYLEEHYKVPSSLDAGTVRRLMREAVVALAKILDVSVREDVGLQSPGWNGRFRIFEEEFPSCAIERRRFEDLVKSFEEEVRKVLRDSDGPFVSRRFLYWQPDDGSNERPELTLLFAVTKPVFDETLLLNLFPTLRRESWQRSGRGSLIVNGRAFAMLQAREGGKISVSPQQDGLRRIWRGKEAMAALRLQLRLPGGVSHQSVMPNDTGLPVDFSVPALFVPHADSKSEWDFFGVGTLKTPALRGIVVASEGVLVEPMNEAPIDDAFPALGTGGTDQGAESQPKRLGLLGNTAFAAWYIRGDVRIHHPVAQTEREHDILRPKEEVSGLEGEDSLLPSEDETVEFRLGQASGARAIYGFRGRLWGMDEEGVPIYSGIPEVVREKEEGVTKIDDVAWRFPNGREHASFQLIHALPVTAVVREEGRIVKRMRVILLPRGADLRYVIGHRKRPGAIDLCGWGRVFDLSVSEVERAASGCRTCGEEAQPYGNDLRVLFPETETSLADFGGRALLRVTTKNSAAGTGSFVLSVPYPREFIGFLLDGKPLKKEVITTEEAKRLVAAVTLSPVNRDDRPVLFVEPANAQIGMPVSALRRYIDFEVNPETLRGELCYDDFREALYANIRFDRPMRADSPRCAALEISFGSRRRRVTVSRTSGQLIPYTQDSETFLLYRTEEMVTEGFGYAPKLEAAQLRYEPLFPAAVPGCVVDVTTNTPANLPLCAKRRDVPWVVYAEGDPKFTVSPALLPASSVPPGAGEGAQPDAQQLAYVERLWTGEAGLFFETRGFVERSVLALLQSPEKEDWAPFCRQLSLLGRRGFAHLPYWGALQGDLPLALAWCFALDARVEEEAERRSLAFSVGRRMAWRWMLLSIRALVRTVNIAAAAFKAECAPLTAGLSASAVQDVEALWLERRWRDILQTDLMETDGLLRAKWMFALLSSRKVTIESDLGRMMLTELQRSDFRAVIRAYQLQKPVDREELLLALQRDAELRAKESLRLDCEGKTCSSTVVLRADRGVRDSFKAVCPSLLSAYEKILQDVFRRRFAAEEALRLRLTATYLFACAWTAAYDRPRTEAERLNGNPFMRQLVSKDSFYLAETLFSVDPDWTRWCFVVAEILSAFGYTEKLDL